MTAPRLAALLLAALATTAGARAAAAQSVQLGVEGEAHAGVPFVLTVAAEGFEEVPEPTVEDFAIAGCKVTAIGVSPNISTSISIVNGRRSESRRVTYVYRFRVEAAAAGRYQIPAVTVTQGTARATSRPAAIEVGEIEATNDMRVVLTLPDRPVSVGETFELTLDWYLRRDVRNQQFSVPLFELADAFDIEAPAAGGDTLGFPIGASELELPFERSNERLDGVGYTRFRFRALATPLRAGTFELPPVQVVARVEVGAQRDAFGFRVPRLALRRAEGNATTIEVSPLPMTGRPPSFVNAVGTSFSINVRASRTVVRLGEPIELEIDVRGDARLHGVSLPPPEALGLAADKFGVADAPTDGELIEDGKVKRFRVTARLLSAEAREIPPLAFSYYDSAKGTYETVRSQPIALSVAGSAVVGAGDVVSGGGSRPDDDAPDAARAPAATSLVGADLSLSEPGDTLRGVLTPVRARPIVWAVYAVPLLLLGFRTWQLRTRERRGEDSAVRRAARDLDRALADGRSAPARDAAPRVAAAVRALARTADADLAPAKALLARLDTEAFDPAASGKPLDGALLDEVRALAKPWRGAGVARKRSGASTTAAAVLLALSAGLATPGWSAEPAAPAGPNLDDARGAYRDALGLDDRDARTRAFARAEGIFRALVERQPDAPELLTDWGNAALGAQDLGRATLAYRRALHLDPTTARARRNLTWVRERAAFTPPAHSGAIDSFFFWRGALTPAQQQLAAALAFAACVLLLVPWGSSLERRRMLRRLALLPAVVWIAVLASTFTARDESADAVVLVDASALRAADSPGAPLAMSTPLPAGTEVTVLEQREAWTRVTVANATGWVQRGALAPVVD